LGLAVVLGDHIHVLHVTYKYICYVFGMTGLNLLPNKMIFCV
jgi:hypothetical protein